MRWPSALVVLALIVAVHAVKLVHQDQVASLRSRADTFEVLRGSLHTGDVLLWNEVKIAEVMRNGPGESVGEHAIDVEIGNSFTHVGMVVHLPDIEQYLLLEPVIYHHQHVIDNWHDSLGKEYGVKLPIHWGGAVRLIDLRSHMIEKAYNRTAAVRRLNLEGVDSNWDESHRALLTKFWRETEQLPEGVTLSAHGQMPFLEGIFSARVIAKALQDLGVLPAEPTARSYSLKDFSLSHGERAPIPYHPPQLVHFDSAEPTEEEERLLNEMRQFYGIPTETPSFVERDSADPATLPPPPPPPPPPPSSSIPEAPPAPEIPSSWKSNDALEPLTGDVANQAAAAARNRLKKRARNFEKYSVKNPRDPNACNPTLCDGALHKGVLKIDFKDFTDVKDKRHPIPLFAQLPRNLDNRVYGDYGDQTGALAMHADGYYYSKAEVFCMCIFHPAPSLPRLPEIPENQFNTTTEGLKFPYDDTVEGVAREYERTSNSITTPTLRVVALDPNDELNGMWNWLKSKFQVDENPGKREASIIGVHLWNLTELTTVPAGAKFKAVPIQSYPIMKLDVSNSRPILKGIFRWGKDKTKVTDKETGAFINVGFNYTAIGPKQVCAHDSDTPCIRLETTTYMYWNSWMKLMRSGDVLLFRTTGKKELSFMQTFNVKISHAAVVYLDAHYAFPMVFQATAVGVGLNSLRHYVFNGDYGTVFYRPLSWNEMKVRLAPELNKRLGEFQKLYLSPRQAYSPFLNTKIDPVVKAQSGKPYNLKRFWQIIKAGRASLAPFFRSFLTRNTKDNKNSLFCSQLVAITLQALDILPPSNFDLFPGDPKQFDGVMKDLAVGKTSNFFAPTDFLPRCYKRSSRSAQGCGGFVENMMFIKFNPALGSMERLDRENQVAITDTVRQFDSTGLRQIEGDIVDNRWEWRLSCPVFLAGLPEQPEFIFPERRYWLCVNLEDLDTVMYN